MRRAKRAKYGNNKFTILAYISGFILLAIIITFVVTYFVYKNKLKNASESLLTTEQIIGLVPNNAENTGDSQPASSEIGKTIQEVQNSIQENIEEKVKQTQEREFSEVLPQVEEIIEQAEPVVAEEKEPEFDYPVEGEVIRTFANESLMFSETLQEWITHLGIDIKADRTTVVKASESGKVISIKNDPRYGLTIVIEHTKGYKTVYSNLLTTEFVQEGETVEKGSSIGTVGNSASFEIADEPHLHFEILKDNQNVDPKAYL